ncbi:hypothetical protein AYO45_05025 [Gammaproteobacteria bacterium SCGC AG-212-F23]|nr:hypothetical protein AYO45_05025 [Gammaproteobacteria bacterium SCGC AG-212-F23]
MHNLYKFFYIIFFLCLTACGFHLRGPFTLAPPLQTVYIESADPYGKLIRNVRDYLKMSGVRIVTQAKDATAILVLSKDTEGQQLVSVSSSQQTRQYNLTLSATFRVDHPNGTTWISQQEVSDSRPITIQSNQVLAGSNEATIFYQIMRQNLAYNIIYALASAGVTQQLLHTPP